MNTSKAISMCPPRAGTLPSPRPRLLKSPPAWGCAAAASRPGEPQSSRPRGARATPASPRPATRSGPADGNLFTARFFVTRHQTTINLQSYFYQVFAFFPLSPRDRAYQYSRCPGWLPPASSPLFRRNKATERVTAKAARWTADPAVTSSPENKGQWTPALHGQPAPRLHTWPSCPGWLPHYRSDRAQRRLSMAGCWRETDVIVPSPDTAVGMM